MERRQNVEGSLENVSEMLETDPDILAQMYSLEVEVAASVLEENVENAEEAVLQDVLDSEKGMD